MTISTVSSPLVIRCLLTMSENMKNRSFKYQQLALGLLLGLLIGIGFMYLVDLNAKEINIPSTINFAQEFSYQSKNLEKSFEINDLEIADDLFKNSVKELKLKGSFKYKISLTDSSYNLENDILELTLTEAYLDDVFIDLDKSTYVDSADGLLSLKEMRIRLCDYEYLKEEFKNTLMFEYTKVEEEAITYLHNEVYKYISNLFKDQNIEIVINYR